MSPLQVGRFQRGERLNLHKIHFGVNASQKMMHLCFDPSKFSQIRVSQPHQNLLSTGHHNKALQGIGPYSVYSGLCDGTCRGQRQGSHFVPGTGSATGVRVKIVHLQKDLHKHDKQNVRQLQRSPDKTGAYDSHWQQRDSMPLHNKEHCQNCINKSKGPVA